MNRTCSCNRPSNGRGTRSRNAPLGSAVVLTLRSDRSCISAPASGCEVAESRTVPRSVIIEDAGACRLQAPSDRTETARRAVGNECIRLQPNESRLSCGALKKNSFLNLRAPSASSAGEAAASRDHFAEGKDARRQAARELSSKCPSCLLNCEEGVWSS